MCGIQTIDMTWRTAGLVMALNAFHIGLGLVCLM